MKIAAFKVKMALFLFLSIMISSCLTMPLSRNFSKYTGTFFGNSTILHRFGNYVITYLTFPVLIVAAIVDMPLSVIHFWTGSQPIMKDPLISQNKTKWFDGTKENEKWLAQISENGNQMKLIQFKDGVSKNTYELSKDLNGMIAVKQYVPAQDIF